MFPQLTGEQQARVVAEVLEFTGIGNRKHPERDGVNLAAAQR